nr:hypothetical protein [Bacillus cereus]
MLISHFAQITCRPNNKTRLESLGYKWIYNTIIAVSIEHLSSSCSVKVSVLCDYCLEKKVHTVLSKPYCQYIKSRINILKDCCPGCQNLKNREISKLKYGTDYYMQNSTIKNKSINTRKTPFTKVKRQFEERGYILLEKEYVNNLKKLKYICIEHADSGIQDISYANLKNGHGCRYCGYNKVRTKQEGAKSHFWKGGITGLSSYLRSKLHNWKKDSLISCNHKCIITGETKNLSIHHLYNFSSIVKEVFHRLKLPVYEKIGSYSVEQLKNIEDMLLELHNKYPLGICINKDLHKQFHNIYGKEHTTHQQFAEFLSMYGINKLQLKYAENDYVALHNNKEKYFLYKRNSSSKYHGVCFVTSSNKWQATISFNGKNKIIGRFKSEYEAAEAYNKKALELFAESATLNKLCPEDKPLVNEFEKNYFKFNTNTSSRFHGVKLDKGKWVVTINYNSKRKYLGSFQTEIEAAYTYNQEIQKILGAGAKINYLTRGEISFAKDNIKTNNQYYKHKENHITIYTCVYFRANSKWECFFVHNGRFYTVGQFPTDLAAALAYNNFIIKNNIKRKLNKIH